jgi:hypothetical protein
MTMADLRPHLKDGLNGDGAHPAQPLACDGTGRP